MSLADALPRAPRAPLATTPYLKAPGQIAVYEQGITLSAPQFRRKSGQRDGRTRGRVQGFSRRSRLRMMRMFGRVQWSRYGQISFVTLTYHHGHRRAEQSPAEHLNNWLTQARQRFPGVQYVWRLEPQQRGAPHYHVMLLFPKSHTPPALDALTAWASESWHRIADPNSEAHAKHGVDVQQVDSFRRAFAYLSKYVAKEESRADQNLPGRRWATSTRLPQRPVATCPLDEGGWRAFRAILRRILQARPTTTEETLRWFDTSPTARLFISADELRRHAPFEWRALRLGAVFRKPPPLDLDDEAPDPALVVHRRGRAPLRLGLTQREQNSRRAPARSASSDMQ